MPVSKVIEGVGHERPAMQRDGATLIEWGRYGVRLAATEEDRAAVYRLRFLVFNLEMNEGWSRRMWMATTSTATTRCATTWSWKIETPESWSDVSAAGWWFLSVAATAIEYTLMQDNGKATVGNDVCYWGEMEFVPHLVSCLGLRDCGACGLRERLARRAVLAAGVEQESGSLSDLNGLGLMQ